MSLSSQAQRIDGAAGHREPGGDEELDARITELARVTADADGNSPASQWLEVRTGNNERQNQRPGEIIESEGRHYCWSVR